MILARGLGFQIPASISCIFHMESVSAAMNLPMQSASKAFSAANFISIDVKFLPPKSEILDGYAFVVVNNSLWKLFRIYSQTNTRPPFPSKEQAAMLPPVHVFFKSTWDPKVAGPMKVSMADPGKLINMTNGEMVPIGDAGYFLSETIVVGTNVSSGKFDPNW